MGALLQVDRLAIVVRSASIDELQNRLGYTFSDRGLLQRALTHSSARASRRIDHDNEQLEFLGDRVLGLVMAERLVKRFPEAEEGTLARGYNRLVRRETCARVGNELELGNFIVLGTGEAGSGGRRKHTIIANACEAVLGAIFLDGGFDEARRVTLRWWTDHFEAIDEVRADPKSALQEWAQSRGLPLPDYAELGRTGPDHAPSFTTEVRIERQEPAQGYGANKRAAEQAAALAFLEREGIWQSEPVE